jgi:hypothetical protein
MQFALRVPQSAIVSERGALRYDEALRRQIEWTLEAADRLNVLALVLATPAEITPSVRNRDLLAGYFERLPRVAGRSYVWSPSGLWEQEQIGSVARKLALVPAFDPLTAEPISGSFAYARLVSLGIQRRFSDTMLEQVATALRRSSNQSVCTVFDSDQFVKQASRLQSLVAQTTP